MPVIDPARLRSAREASGLTRENVAVALGMSYPTVASYERGVNTPPGPVLVRLARLYQVSVESLCVPDVPAGAAQ